MPTNTEVRAKWSFGLQSTAEGGAVLGSTGTGTRIFFGGNARETMIYIETAAACTCSYQILAARTETGATLVLSSGTLGASDLDVLHLTGPQLYLVPRLKTITSTAVNVTVEMVGN